MTEKKGPNRTGEIMGAAHHEFIETLMEEPPAGVPVGTYQKNRARSTKAGKLQREGGDKRLHGEKKIDRRKLLAESRSGFERHLVEEEGEKERLVRRNTRKTGGGETRRRGGSVT